VPILEAFLEWLWKTTERTRLVGPVPSYNRLALRLARAAGFREFDVVQNAVHKGGRAYDLVLLEIRKPT
jgi:RimJ/RimL family protein N-acetyltransferase